MWVDAGGGRRIAVLIESRLGRLPEWLPAEYTGVPVLIAYGEAVFQTLLLPRSGSQAGIGGSSALLSLLVRSG